MEEKQKSRLRFSRTGKIIVAIIAIAGVAGVAAFVTYTQYFPSVPTVTAAANLVANCGTASTSPLTVAPATVTAGSAFTLVYSCSSGTAISVTNGPITRIPTEAPAIGAGGMPTTLGLIAPGVTCTPTAGIQLTQSVAANIPTGDYDYCATGTSAPVTGVVSFTVTWA